MCNSFGVFVARFTQTALEHCFKNEENRCNCKIEENRSTQTAVATYAKEPQNDLVMIKNTRGKGTACIPDQHMIVATKFRKNYI